MPSIAVIGAGVVGLSTARCIQNTIDKAAVTVIADSFEQDTTSHGAAGIFRPTSQFIPGIAVERLKKWVGDSWNHYDKLARSSEAKDAGTSIINGYHVYDGKNAYDKVPNLTAEYSYQFRPLTSNECDIFQKKYENGYNITTLLVECTWYLPYLTSQFTMNGGVIKKKTIKSFEELAGQYDVIVNCTGLGAKKLLDDPHINPIRGQVIRVNAPWIKHFYYRDDQTYIIPCRESVVVGGTRQYGRYDTSIDENDKIEMWKRACELVPSLTKAEVQWVWSGLRPHRTPIRVESEILSMNKQQLKIVHNYGHGGNGVALSWGTACEAAQLVKSLIKPTSHL